MKSISDISVTVLESENNSIDFDKLFLPKNYFQTSVWLNYIDQSTERRHVVFVAYENDRIIAVAIFQKTERNSIFNKAILDSNKENGGLLIVKSHGELAIKKIAHAVLKYAKERHVYRIFFEITEDNFQFIPILINSGLIIKKLNCDFILDIQRHDFLSKLSQSKRNQVKQSLQHNIEIKRHDNLRAFLDIFYPIYEKSLSSKRAEVKKIGNFLGLNVLPIDDLILISAEINRIVIACVIVLMDKKSSIAYYLYSASSSWHREKRATERLIYESILICRLHQINEFNFLRTSYDAKSGVYKFKKQWGGIPKSIAILQYESAILSRLNRIKLFFKKMANFSL